MAVMDWIELEEVADNQYNVRSSSMKTHTMKGFNIDRPDPDMIIIESRANGLWTLTEWEARDLLEKLQRVLQVSSV
jgi:hypothetical protein